MRRYSEWTVEGPPTHPNKGFPDLDCFQSRLNPKDTALICIGVFNQAEKSLGYFLRRGTFGAKDT